MQEVVIPWPGGEHAFRLGLAELETIQQKTDCGPEYLLHRINAGQWHVCDLIEVLRGVNLTLAPGETLAAPAP